MPEKSLLHYDIYTDGSAKTAEASRTCGGWAYCILFDGDIIRRDSGTVLNTTNQRMELQAVIEALKACKMFGSEHSEYHFYCDSAYIINCCHQGWFLYWEKHRWKNSANKAVANAELWCEIIPYFKNKSYFFHKVKAHSDNYYNNLVDDMAQKAANPLNLIGG